MKILLIPDKFKGSLNAEEVVEALTAGIIGALPSAQITAVLASDGGEGFLDAIAKNITTERIETTTAGPLGRPVHTHYLLTSSRTMAYIEMAMASGLELLDPEERNPLHTSTWGTGLQIRDAMDKGAQRIYLGIGGSATNDGGIGAAAALGYRFLDASGTEVPLTGAGLSQIQQIVKPKKAVEGVAFFAVNDVNNPLYGENGAAFVYGPQKGADPNALMALDKGLRHLEGLVKRELGKDVAQVPGSGAAGGMAYGLKAFFNAEFISGTEFILELAGLGDRMKNDPPDLLITGEGRIDPQSLSGKLIQGVLGFGKQYEVPVLAVCGLRDISESKLLAEGFEHVIEIRDPKRDLEYNMAHARVLLEEKIKAYFLSQV